jgi:putative ABC transport system permease protein
VRRRKRMLEDLEQDIADHIDRETQDHIDRGMSPQEARYAALRKFGNVARVKEDAREVWSLVWWEHLLQDLGYGLRMLRKSPGFTAVAVLTLALGIGASTVVFSVFYNLLFNSFAAKNASRLAVPVLQNADRAAAGDSEWQLLSVNLEDLDAIRDQNQVFENIAGYSTTTAVLASDGAQTYQFYDGRVTADAFDFYGVSPLLGRGIIPADGKPGAPPVFVMSYKTWKGGFSSDPTILGKNFVIDGDSRTLVGVMPPRFQAFGPLQQIWIPIVWSRGTPRSAWPGVAAGASRVYLLARLKPEVNMQQACADLGVIVKRLSVLHPDDYPKHFTARLQSASDALLGPMGIGGVIAVGFNPDIKHLLYDLLVAVTMLLLIACSNVANLLLARAAVREKEIAVRSVLGATRGRMVRQLLVESFVLAIPACVLGSILAVFGMKVVAAAMPQKSFVGGATFGGETVIGLDPAVLLFAVGVTLVTTLICGLAPALHAVRGDLQPHLADGGKGTDAKLRRGMFRAGLVVGEVALSVVLLTGAGLMIRSFFALTHVDLGFNPGNVLVTYFVHKTHNQAVDRASLASPQREVMVRQVAERLKNLPGVSDASIEDALPGYSPSAGPEVTVPGATHAETAGLVRCDENLLQVLELRLIQGNWLSAGEVQRAQYVAVINQTLAHDFFGGNNPVGQQLKVKNFQTVLLPNQPPQDTYFQIVGVVADMKDRGLQQPALPMAFIPHTIAGSYFLLLKTRVPPASLVHSVQEQVWAVDHDQVFFLLDPLKDFLQKLTYAIPEFGLTAFAPLASIGLLLVMVGVFSVMAYTVSLQTREIGIRMALGAQQSSILKMILGKGARLIAAGIMIGLAVSYWLTRFLASQIWGVSIRDPWTFAGVLILIVLVGLAACFVPARRAARVDPMTALRCE